MTYVEALTTEFLLCSRPSREKGGGARDVLHALRDIGGTILLLPDGPSHQDPEGDITDCGSIIVRPGLAHPLLQRGAGTRKNACVASCSFGYIHSSHTFDLSQPANPNKPEQVETVAKGQFQLAQVIYRELRPAYGWIDEPGENTFATKYVKTCGLKYLFWANFFGPAYVNRYGRDFLLDAPGWKKQELADGGILYVVDESYMHWRTTEATDALRYFESQAPSIRQYRSRGFERTEAMLAGDKRKRSR